jgi:IS5 family transposase
VERGNPADAPMLPDAVARIKERSGKVPRAVTADRGSGEAAIEKELLDLGVTTVVIPRKGRHDAARRTTEKSRPFQWLARGEGPIGCREESCLPCRILGGLSRRG